MKRIVLTRGVVKKIHAAVDRTYDRVLARFLEKHPVDKRIVFSSKPRVTLPSIFAAASREEGARPDDEMFAGLKRIAEGYVEAQRARTKAQVVKAVQSWLSEAAAGGVDTDVKTVLGGELAGVFGKAHDALHQIADSEASNARNTGTLNGVIRVNAAAGVEDPRVFFVVVRDDSLCDECKKIHLLEDGVTPRVWFLSEIKYGYHRKGEDKPSVGGLHPHCRCSLVTIMDGYGFDASGALAWVEHGHDEMAKQRGTEKREPVLDFELMTKSDVPIHHGWKLTGAPFIRHVPIDQVDHIPWDAQDGDEHEPSVQDYMAALQRAGGSVPVPSGSEHDGRIDVANGDGNHRVEAARRLGHTHVPVSVRPQWAYHGTTTHHLPGIQRGGLLASSQSGDGPHVYIGVDEATARMYGDTVVRFRWPETAKRLPGHEGVPREWAVPHNIPKEQLHVKRGDGWVPVASPIPRSNGG